MVSNVMLNTILYLVRLFYCCANWSVLFFFVVEAIDKGIQQAEADKAKSFANQGEISFVSFSSPLILSHLSRHTNRWYFHTIYSWRTLSWYRSVFSFVLLLIDQLILDTLVASLANHLTSENDMRSRYKRKKAEIESAFHQEIEELQAKGLSKDGMKINLSNNFWLKYGIIFRIQKTIGRKNWTISSRNSQTRWRNPKCSNTFRSSV